MCVLNSVSVGSFTFVAALALASCSEATCEERRTCPPEPISIALSTTDLAMPAGDSATVEVAVMRSVGQDVVVSAEGLPAGVTATSLNLPSSGEPPVLVTLELVATSAAKTGTTTVTIQATAGSQKDEETLRLTVLLPSG